MSHRPSKILQYVESATEEETIDAIRQLAIASHHRNHAAPTSTPHTIGLHSGTQITQEQALDNEVMKINDGGVKLNSVRDEIRHQAQSFYPSPAYSPRSSSKLFSQFETTMNTPKEIENWASNHNRVFYESLAASVCALRGATSPQTPPHDYSSMSRSPELSYMPYSGQHSNGSSLKAAIPASTAIPIPQYALAPIPRHFQPNNMVLERMGLLNAPYAQNPTNSNYVGNRAVTSNAREVPDLPNWKNCALFLTHIPVETNLHEIFSVINTGAVFCLHINLPSGIHKTKAAKLAFMTPEAAAAFLRQIHSIDGVVLHGQRIRGRYNRNGYVRNESNWQSRILLVEGPSPMMTLEYWTSHFARFSEFELECYRLSAGRVGGLSRIEFRFTRIDGQAQTCLQSIRGDPTLEGVVQVKYGIDPCGYPMA